MNINEYVKLAVRTEAPAGTATERWQTIHNGLTMPSAARLLHALSGTTTFMSTISMSSADIDMNGNDIVDIGQIGESLSSLSFGSGWGNYGSGYANGQYKKVGDLVFVTGLVGRSSGSGTTIATLPSGYRPLARHTFSVRTNSGVGVVDILTTGAIELVSGGATFTQLSGLVFSTL